MNENNRNKNRRKPIITQQQKSFVSRDELIIQLIARDGNKCSYPNCDLPFVKDTSHERTIDHITPQAWAKEHGWTYDEIWHVSNLQLMGRKCNALKSDRLPNEDGSLPELPRDTRIKAADKSKRPIVCETCGSGRMLIVGEICDDCGSGPQPTKTPRMTQRTPKECSHGWVDPADHCWMCHLGYVERRPAIDVIIFGP